jgi:opacity protein-like surface antigen
MRLVFITICLLILSSVVSAQTEQGKFLIGAQTGLSFSSMDTEFKSDEIDRELGTEKKISLIPQLGYFVSDGFLVGASLPIVSNKVESGNEEMKNSRIALIPFARYYFGKTNVKPYLHAGFGFGSAKEELASDEQDYSLAAFEFGGGMAVFLNESIAVDLGLGYTSTRLKPDGGVNNSRLVTSGLAFQVGFTFSI